ncbi:MAG: hypothetical protein WCX46_03885 [Candidatus Paceibacterota bacterium]
MKDLIKNIVKNAEILKDKYTDQKNIPVYYACIFCQTDDEYKEFTEKAYKMGKKIQERQNSLLFRITPIETSAGKIEILRIRQPDEKFKERGDADFVVNDYQSFREKYSNQQGFKIIPRDNSEMIELYIEGENVRVYFSDPKLIKSLSILN